MSSESSDDVISFGVCSQDSNANAGASCNANAPILEFASLCLFDPRDLSRSQPQADSDYDSDYNVTNGKRKQRSQESETDVQQKKLKKDVEMECQEMDSECQVQSEKSDAESDCEADNEEEEELESEEECDGACKQEPEIFSMDDEPIAELPSVTNSFQPSTSGMKRKNDDKLVSPTVSKVKRSCSNPEEN